MAGRFGRHTGAQRRPDCHGAGESVAVAVGSCLLNGLSCRCCMPLLPSWFAHYVAEGSVLVRAWFRDGARESPVREVQTSSVDGLLVHVTW